MAAQRQVRLGYRTAAGNARTFEVDPWSVVVRYGRWYLLCHSHHADELRTFRIDRITEVHLLDGTFEVPADLDPAAELEANLGKGWEHETHVVFEAPLEEVRPWIRPTLGELRARPGRRVRAGRHHEQRARRTPASGWPAYRSRSRWWAATELRAAVAAVGERLTRRSTPVSG